MGGRRGLGLVQAAIQVANRVPGTQGLPTSGSSGPRQGGARPLPWGSRLEAALAPSIPSSFRACCQGATPAMGPASTGEWPPSNSPDLAEAMPLQRETACRDRLGPGGPRGAGWPGGWGGRLSSSERKTRANPQRPCLDGAFARRNCGKTPVNLGKSPCPWGNPLMISRSNPLAAQVVAGATETPDRAAKPGGGSLGARQKDRLGPIGPCLHLVTETVWD